MVIAKLTINRGSSFGEYPGNLRVIILSALIYLIWIKFSFYILVLYVSVMEQVFSHERGQRNILFK